MPPPNTRTMYDLDDRLEDMCFRLAETETCIFGDDCPNQHDSQGMCIATAKGKGTVKKNGSAKKYGSQRRCISPPTTHLQAFFAKYPPFVYDPSRSASKEFYRLCEYFNWERDSVDRVEAYEAYKTALVKQFNDIYGTDGDSLSAWRKLCEIVHVYPIPARMTDCRQAVRNAHVNLVDLVDREFTNATITVFPSEEALNEYTRKTGKFFPRYNAHAGELLKFLLRRREGRVVGRGTWQSKPRRK